MAAPKGKRAARVNPEMSATDPPTEPVLERAVQERIGTHLRAMYDDLMQQPVPDRFAELLSRLETQGGKDRAQ
jgi:hypothetical protein